MRLRLWLLLLGLLLCPTVSHAVTCSATMSPVTFSSAVNPLPLTSTDTTAQATLSYSCTKQLGDLLGVTLCFNIGPSSGGSSVNTRSMAFTGPPASTLSYQLYQDGGYTTVWGSQYQSGTMPIILSLTLLSSGQTTGSYTVYAKLTTPQPSAAPGNYQDSFAGMTASVTSSPGLTLPPLLPSACSGTVVANFPFVVSATVSKQCHITTNNIDFGPVTASQTNLTASNSSAVNVTCSNSTPYTIGLVPSNNNTAGSGLMKGTGTNTDQVPYQLSSTAGPSGAPWGSVAGNMVAGTGAGVAQPKTVYVTVPSANYTPDTYSDTVTVNVTY